MKKLGLNEIREKFLSFFESKGHLRLPSFPLIPQNDNSLLLINAGMAPLKPYFTGKEIPPKSRVTTCQKCIRTPDIERVGKTARHATFFEMLGNFSFGDYFKREAIAWAWEFVTKVLEIDEDRLWVTIYEEDDEAFDIWTKEVGVAPERVVRMGKEDNFWEIGTGPCGPCSEIHFDRGEEAGCGKPDCKVGCDCDRFVEFWNLVFTQFDKDEQGNYNRLAKPNIDTGMGLERIAAIMQGVGSLFEVDTVRNIMLKISRMANVRYGENDKTDVSLRVITDHIRSTTFMVSDGVLPSNEGRGYVLRRLLRRASRHGKLLGINEPFLYKIADTVINESKEAYGELAEKADYIKKVIRIEEEKFSETIDSGLGILESYIDEMKKSGKTVLDGVSAFRLYDTYGFPIDLTVEILAEQGMNVDMEKFGEEMEKQRIRSRETRQDDAGAGWSGDVYSKLDKSIKTEFLGYDNTDCEGKILAVIKDGQIADSVGTGEKAVIILDKTVIYGESGGQVGDSGYLEGSGAYAAVTDAKKLGDERILHFVEVSSGLFKTGDSVKVAFDIEKRRATQRNHSATHLLHKALKEVLGEHVAQAGSLVTPGRLRFDFSHFEAMTDEQIAEVERRVNAAILAALPVDIRFLPIEEAKALGATALFGEKYGSTVRVVRMGDYSMELCGGCHLKNTSEAGLFKIISESSIASGIRRIEAVTGTGVLEYIAEKERTIENISQILKSNPKEVETRANAFVNELKSAQKTIEQLRTKLAKSLANDMLSRARSVNGIKIITEKLQGMSMDELTTIGDNIVNKEKSVLLVLAGMNEGKINLLAMASKEVVEKGVHCGNLIREVARTAGGSGGGKPDMAKAGAKIESKIDDALAMVDGWVTANAKA